MNKQFFDINHVMIKIKKKSVHYFLCVFLFLVLIFIALRSNIEKHYIAKFYKHSHSSMINLRLEKYPSIHVQVNENDLKKVGWNQTQSQISLIMGVYCFLGIFPQGIDLRGIKYEKRILIDGGHYGLIVDGVDGSVNITSLLKDNKISKSIMPIKECFY